MKTKRFFRYLILGVVRGVAVAGAISAISWIPGLLQTVFSPDYCSPNAVECFGVDLYGFYISMAAGMFVIPAIVIGTVISGFLRDNRG
jgi:hypothetical protein